MAGINVNIQYENKISGDETLPVYNANRMHMNIG